jgi:hypothetical protein
MKTSTLTGGLSTRRQARLALLVASVVILSPAGVQAQSISPSPTSGGSTFTTGASAAGASTDETVDATGDAANITMTPEQSANAASNTALRGGMLQGETLDASDGFAADDLNQLINPAETAIEAGEEPGGRTDDGMGIRIGTFTLRPTVNQSINSERTKSGGATSNRSYLATTGNATLTSDWSRHALTVTGQGIYERNLSGDAATEPQASINADLRLDLADDTIVNLTTGYAFEREDANDPNAVSSASTQAGVDRYTAGAAVTRDLGILRGTAALAATRVVYGSARLSDGSNLSLSDRDRTAIEGRVRLGYELSPAIIPFIEATIGQSEYDDSRDASGYARSSKSYGGRGGVQFDFGEKLRGELGLGYAIVDYDDGRLASVDAFTTDGSLVWSPQRGTDVDLGLRTTIQDSTSAGESGWVEYQLTSGISHQLLSDLTGRLNGSTTLRDFPDVKSQIDWQVGAGLVWSINRYFDVTASLGYEHTDGGSGSDSNLVRAGLGLSLRR